MIDLSGKKFNKLTVLAFAGKNKIGKVLWKCQCECGNYITTLSQNIKSGATKSCGCAKFDNFKNRVGNKYGKLTVLNFDSRVRNKFGNTIIKWKCQCDCGNITVVRSDALKRNNTKSCGCLRSKSKILKNNKTAKNRLFDRYKRQAAYRNIKFKINMKAFIQLIQLPCHYCGTKLSNTEKSKYKTHTDEFKYNGIDRIDNSKDYSVSNCVPCCKICNWWKMDLQTYDFLNHVKKISSYNFS